MAAETGINKAANTKDEKKRDKKRDAFSSRLSVGRGRTCGAHQTQVGPGSILVAGSEVVLPSVLERGDSEHDELLRQVPHAEAVRHPPERLVQVIQSLLVSVDLRESTVEDGLVCRMKAGAYPDVQVEPALRPTGGPTIARSPSGEVLRQPRAHLEVDGSEVQGLRLSTIDHQLWLTAGEVEASEVPCGGPEAIHPHGILVDRQAGDLIRR